MPNNAERIREFVKNLTSHQPALRTYVLSQMPGLPGISDVLQEVNLLLWEKESDFESGTNFRAWAFAVARYKILEHRRKLKKGGWLLFDNELAEQLAEETSESAEQIERRLQALEFCLEKLSESDRRLVQSRYAADSTLKKYAEEIGQPAGSLRSTLFKIRKALRDCVRANMPPGSPQPS